MANTTHYTKAAPMTEKAIAAIMAAVLAFVELHPTVTTADVATYAWNKYSLGTAIKGDTVELYAFFSTQLLGVVNLNPYNECKAHGYDDCPACFGH